MKRKDKKISLIRRYQTIAKRIQKNKNVVVAEIGVLEGELTKMVLDNHSNVTYIQVDRWHAYSEEERERENNSTMTFKEQKYFDDAKKKNLQNIKKYRKRVKIIEDDSVNAANQIEDETIDICFIDAAHSYIGVTNDITAWFPKVKKNGWIGGHDTQRETVMDAVNDFFKDKGYCVFCDKNNTWWVKKKIE